MGESPSCDSTATPGSVGAWGESSIGASPVSGKSGVSSTAGASWLLTTSTT